MGSCIFCDILAGKSPASMVYEDDLCAAFMDIHPITPGHVLVVPRQHCEGLADLPPELGAHLFQAAQKIGLAIARSGLRCQGLNLFLADGKAAGQQVAHVHLHVIPRFERDGFGLKFPPGYDNLPERAELDIISQKIRRRL